MVGTKHARIATLTTDDGRTHRVVEERHPSKSYGARFMIVFSEAMAKAARKIKRPVTFRLLLVLPTILSFTEYRQVRNADLATELETDTGAISRSMRELHELGILERDGKGPRTAWRMSSDWGWNSSAEAWHQHRRTKTPSTPPAPAAAVPEKVEKTQTRLTLLRRVP